MKLYFVCGDAKKYIGEPHTEEELGKMLLDDGKKRFVIFQGRIEFALAVGTEFKVNQSSDGAGKYILEN